MNFAGHIDAAMSLMRAERLLTESDLSLAASEMIWGATSHVVDAIYNLQVDSRGHPSNNRERLRVIDYLEEKYGPDPSLSTGFDLAANRLHNHFYTNRLSLAQLVEAMDIGRVFISQMLDLAERERADAESADGE